MASQQLPLSNSVSVVRGGQQRERRELDADKSCLVGHRTDFEKISASPLSPGHSNAILPNLSLPFPENPLASDDEDSYAETEPELDDQEELSELAQRHPSAFHAAISNEVCRDFFFMV